MQSVRPALLPLGLPRPWSLPHASSSAASDRTRPHVAAWIRATATAAVLCRRSIAMSVPCAHCRAVDLKGLTFLAAEAPPERSEELDRTMVQCIVNPGNPSLESHNCTVGRALTLLDLAGEKLVNDTVFAVVDKDKRFEGTISLVALLKLIDTTLTGAVRLRQRDASPCSRGGAPVCLTCATPLCCVPGMDAGALVQTHRDR